MDIGWCVCDLDGTLLDSKGRLSGENVAALKKLMGKGVEVILATGRTDLFVRNFVDKIGVSQPVISCNGGMIRDVATGEVIFGRMIGQRKAADIAGYCLRERYDTLAYTPEHVYFLSGSRKIGTYHRYNAEVESAFQVPLREVRTVEDLPLKEVVKFLISNIDPDIARRIQQEQNPDGELSMVQSMQDVLDIMAKDVSKGQALLFLAGRIGIDLARTVVFGDNHNDVSMLRLAGWPIAVANAEDEVKHLAKFVAPSNNDSGVAYAIEKYILEG